MHRIGMLILLLMILSEIAIAII